MSSAAAGELWAGCDPDQLEEVRLIDPGTWPGQAETGGH